MRKLLIFISLFLSFTIYGQLEKVNTFTIEDANKQYGETVFPPTLIIDMDGGDVWLIKSKMSPDSTLATTSNKILWDNSNGEGGDPTTTPTVDYVTITPHSALPSASEGRMAILQTTDGNILYVYTDGVWLMYMPINKSISGVTISIPTPN